MEIEQIYGALPTLETNRLLLRKLTLEDAKDMYEYGSDEDVSKHVSWNAHQTIADTEAFIDVVLDKYENHQVAPWGIEWKENGKLIGTIDYVWWKPALQSAEIGYALAKDYWGQGITTEAVQKVLAFGFDSMDLIRVQARCLLDNVGSKRVMEKAGMTFEGIMRKAIMHKGRPRDIRMYSILKEEW